LQGVLRKFVASAVLLLGATLAARADDGVVGHWLTEGGKGVVAIERCGASICGKIAWYKHPISDNPREVDFRNPDPNLRERPLCNLPILRDFRPTAGGGWEEGHIYSPEKGDTYNANIVVLDSDHLKLRGYIGIPLLGESQVWTRAEGHERCK